MAAGNTVVNLNAPMPEHFIRDLELPIGWGLRAHDMTKGTIDIEDPEGKVTRLRMQSVIQASCESCDFELYAHPNFVEGMKCPHCGSVMRFTWGQARIAFLPEAEPRLSSVPPSKG